jgi:hypothetical protein
MLRLLGRIAMSGVILLPAVDSAAAQGLTPVVESALQAPIQVPAVTAFQLQRYLMKGMED